MPRGGYRPGAGRPSKKKDETAPKKPAAKMPEAAAATDDPVAFLVGLMNNPLEDIRTRADAAKALLPYKYAKLGEGGKKEKKQADAEKVAGRFQAAAPPKLAAVNGKRI